MPSHLRDRHGEQGIKAKVLVSCSSLSVPVTDHRAGYLQDSAWKGTAYLWFLSLCSMLTSFSLRILSFSTMRTMWLSRILFSKLPAQSSLASLTWCQVTLVEYQVYPSSWITCYRQFLGFFSRAKYPLLHLLGTPVPSPRTSHLIPLTT